METGALAPPAAEQSGGTDTNPASPQLSGFFSPMFVLAESCSGLFEADPIKAKLKESGHGIREERADRGLRWGIEVVAQKVNGRRG